MTTETKMCACGRFAPTQACVPEKCELHVRELSLARLPGRGPMRQTSTEKEDAARRAEAQAKQQGKVEVSKPISSSVTSASASPISNVTASRKQPARVQSDLSKMMERIKKEQSEKQQHEDQKKYGMSRSR